MRCKKCGTYATPVVGRKPSDKFIGLWWECEKCAEDMGVESSRWPVNYDIRFELKVWLVRKFMGDNIPPDYILLLAVDLRDRDLNIKENMERLRIAFPQLDINLKK